MLEKENCQFIACSLQLHYSCLFPTVPTIHTVAQESLSESTHILLRHTTNFTGQTVYPPQLSHTYFELDSILKHS